MGRQALSIAFCWCLLAYAAGVAGDDVPSSIVRCTSGCNALQQPPPPPDLSRRFVIDQVQSQGEFYVITSDGRRLNGQDAAQVPIDNGARAVTGPNGHARLIFPDGSTFTMDAGSEFAIDDFVYDSVGASNLKHFTATIVKGVFRWVSGHTHQYFPHIVTGATAADLRGTDFEVGVSPDGSGYIKLFSGELLLTPFDSNETITLEAGQMISYSDFTKLQGPMPIN